METTFLAKVGLLITISLLSGAAGSWLGRNARSMFAFIVLAIAFIGGVFVLWAAVASPPAGILGLSARTFICGLFIATLLSMRLKEFGVSTVAGAFICTAGVMAATVPICLFSGINFAPVFSMLLIAVLGLILIGCVCMFSTTSRATDMIYLMSGAVLTFSYLVFLILSRLHQLLPLSAALP